MGPRHRRVVVSRHGGPEVLQVVEEAAPEPGPGEVRVTVLAAGVSAYDLMFRGSGMLPGTPRPPFTPGEDIVGVVDTVGEGVSGVHVGQMVAGATFALGVGGGYAELVCLPATELVPVPAGVDPAEAVCLVVNYLTAYSALNRTATVSPGEQVLVHGAAGGVGTALLDLGRSGGLEMYGTASAPNHDLVAKLGATAIDYRNEDFVARIRALTGDGVDVVLDPVGGSRQLWRSHQALRKGGKLVWFGVAGSKKSGLRVIPASLLMRSLLVLIPDGKHAPLPADLDKDNAWYRATLTTLLGLLADGTLTPVVADRIALVDAAQAHDRLQHGGHAGKFVLVTSS